MEEIHQNTDGIDTNFYLRVFFCTLNLYAGFSSHLWSHIFLTQGHKLEKDERFGFFEGNNAKIMKQ